MSELEVEKIINGEEHTFIFRGSIDENASKKMPQVPKNSDISIVIDLDKVLYISSFGADIWKRWMRAEFDSTIYHVTVQRIPPCFIRVLNVMSELIPANWDIESFYVPYAGAADSAPENVLFLKEKNFSKTDLIIPPMVLSKIDDRKLQPDVHPAKYFRFLWNRFENIKIRTLEF